MLIILLCLNNETNTCYELLDTVGSGAGSVTDRNRNFSKSIHFQKLYLLTNLWLNVGFTLQVISLYHDHRLFSSYLYAQLVAFYITVALDNILNNLSRDEGIIIRVMFLISFFHLASVLIKLILMFYFVSSSSSFEVWLCYKFNCVNTSVYNAMLNSFIYTYCFCLCFYFAVS
jgi:hypothetical protein